jgi:hypothetical protein
VTVSRGAPACFRRASRLALRVQLPRLPSRGRCQSLTQSEVVGLGSLCVLSESGSSKSLACRHVGGGRRGLSWDR